MQIRGYSSGVRRQNRPGSRFLRHAPVVVNIASIEEEVEWRAINEAIAATGLRIMGVSGCKIPRLKTEIDRAGIPLLTEGKEKASRPAPSDPTRRRQLLVRSQKRV